MVLVEGALVPEVAVHYEKGAKVRIEAEVPDDIAAEAGSVNGLPMGQLIDTIVIEAAEAGREIGDVALVVVVLVEETETAKERGNQRAKRKV